MPDIILNSSGEKVRLTQREADLANMLQNKYNREYRNALGYDIPITTLTAISKRVVEQKFFTIDVPQYVPMVVGNGAWSDQIITYRDYQVSGDFETGNINTAANQSRLAEADAGMDVLYNPVIDWGKTINWSFVDLQKASRSGNWDLIVSKERSRKRNWDLGVQKIAFLGSSSNSLVKGLLTQSTVNSNTSLITQYISSMNATQFQALVAGLVSAFRSNCAFSAWPDRFIMPELDYNGLGVLVPGSAGTFPVSMLDYLTKVFRDITRNPNFQILPCAYSDEVNNTGVTGLGKNRYTLMHYDEDTLRMDIPVPYTNTLQNTINGFQFQNVGYGEYTGALAYRPLEILYFDFT